MAKKNKKNKQIGVPNNYNAINEPSPFHKKGKDPGKHKRNFMGRLFTGDWSRWDDTNAPNVLAAQIEQGQTDVTDALGEYQQMQGEIKNLWGGAQNLMNIGDNFGGVQTDFANAYGGVTNAFGGLQNQYAGMENMMED